jgi:tetratricopeptide (TPR) repeat protein
MRYANRVNKSKLARVFLLAGATFTCGIATGYSQNQSPQPSQAAGPPPTGKQYEDCLALTRTDPQRAFDQAMAWRKLGGSFPADHCAAVALVALKRYPEAAKKLQDLAGAMMQADPLLRAGALAQAGNAWLLAGKANDAKVDFDAALSFKPNDPEIFIDRAEASAAEGKFFDAVDDLNRALDISPNRADALIYRASAYRQLNTLDLALDDAEHALTIEPNAVAGLLERGNIRRLKGDVDGARADWERIEQLAPGSEEASAAEKNLASLDDKGSGSGGAVATTPSGAAKP